MPRPLAPLLPLALLAGLSLPACHGRYKRNADALGKVQLKVRVTDDATVNTGAGGITEAPTDAVAAAEVGVELAKVVLGQKVQAKLDKAVDRGETRAVLVDAFTAELDQGALPYKVGDKGRGRMIIEVTDFGLDATDGTPTAYIHAHTEIFNKDGKKVYNANSVCTKDVGPGLDLPFTTADDLAALKTLQGLKPAQMEALLLRVTEKCAAEVAQKLVDHL